MKKKIHTQQSGFTLIEIMISIGLFVVIMTLGITAVLNINRGHKKTQAMRTAFDNLSFIMEDMSRNIRLGSNIRCLTSSDINASPLDVSLLSGGDCSTQNPTLFMSFTPPLVDPTDPTKKTVYAILNDTALTPPVTRIYKITGSSSSTALQAITPPDIYIDATRSGFVLTGTSISDTRQARVVIRLAGEIHYQDITTPFDLQTTVSQRLLDF